LKKIYLKEVEDAYRRNKRLKLHGQSRNLAFEAGQYSGKIKPFT
jgi:hypothetical protein